MKNDFLFFLEEKHRANKRSVSKIEYIVITALIVLCIFAGFDQKPFTTELVHTQTSNSSR